MASATMIALRRNDDLDIISDSRSDLLQHVVPRRADAVVIVEKMRVREGFQIESVSASPLGKKIPEGRNGGAGMSLRPAFGRPLPEEKRKSLPRQTAEL